MDARWWQTSSVDARVNGTFKGGGAKGLLYGGALLELREHGLWFRAVAGSSAGSITAALIASGLSPDAMVSSIGDGLRRVQVNYLGDLIGRPRYGVKKVAPWLEEILAGQVERLGGRAQSTRTKTEPVTFAELQAASGIELFVVTVDIADNQPRVFNAALTPNISVTDAVMASSSIPVMFSPGQLQTDASGRAKTHKLIDGGVWANYPAFIFRDPSFRSFHGLPPLPVDSMTIGFTLDTKPPGVAPAAVALKPVATTRIASSILQWVARNYVMTFIPLIIVLQTAYTIHIGGLIPFKDFAYYNEAWLPGIAISVIAFTDGFVSSFGPGTWSVYAVLVAVAVALALAGGSLLESGVPSMKTLMSVGTDVPYWVGAYQTDHVIRLNVPPWLGTTTFKLKPEKIAEAIELGRADAKRQLPMVIEEMDRGGLNQVG
jgi:predicted acylesterase/phospholipase RssA